MRRTFIRLACASAALAMLASESFHGDTGRVSASQGRMSFHNRLLLNRAAVSGLKSIEVLLLTTKEGADQGVIADVSALVTRLGGRVLRTETAVGYMRVEIAPERLLELTAFPAIQTYQVSSLSRGAWYRDGPPLSNAQMFRGFEVTPIAATEPVNTHAGLPVVTPAESREPGFTADDAGMGEWMARNPTFDGRGVTIALLESGLPSFSDPTLRSAKTLDGRDVPKVAGILNAVDSRHTDETRVRLHTVIDVPKSWARVGNRTYILPRPGSYRLGMLDVPAGSNVIHQFAVIEDQTTREVWIDSNGDASFQDEAPLADVNERFDPRFLTLIHPRKAAVSFVMGRGREPHVVHIYIGKGSHQAMTVSVAAGSRTDDGLAYGVAPNARVLLVRTYSTDTGLGNTFEAFIEAAQHPDVDVISASSGLSIVPDTAADFAGALFSRLIATYGKPIVNSAGNTSLMLAGAHAYGETLSVGGILAPETYAALTGGRPLEQVIVHPISAAGPALDGAIKPDFLAPMERLAADLPWNSGVEGTPRSAPTQHIPPGYQVSCCTSATSPYAAGAAALLISAAKQSNVAYSAGRLSRALRMSARLLPGYQAHEQGNGALDINAAWRALKSDIDPPRIVASGAIAHPLAQYAARGQEGQGILEFEGWTAGMKGTREIRLRRESGPPEPVTYRVSWAADDGTFSSARSVTLHLGETVPLRVKIDVKSPGAHSGLLNLHDVSTGAIVFRTQATVVAAERIDPASGSIRVKGAIGLMRQRAHYFHVPPATRAIAFELEVIRGVIQPTILQSHGLSGDYYMQVHPMNTFTLGPGTYHVVMPDPEPGTWTLRLDNRSVWLDLPPGFGPRDDADAEYTLTMRVLGSSLRPSPAANGTVSVRIRNTGSLIAEPVLQAWPGLLKSHRAAFLGTGLPNLIDIDVPPDAASISLQLRSEQEGTNVELYLYDCTTGECFSYDIGFPAAASQTVVVRRPAAGRWVAAVNAAPFPAAAGSFVLDEVVTKGTPERRVSAGPRGPGSRWDEAIGSVPTLPPVDERTPVVLLELLDAAAERGELEHPWSTAPHYVKLRDRPVALGTAIYRR
jgi:hypothetical protein